ncbi:hypothetical protein GA0115237_108247 [Streptomyces sp. ScaeMP-6W]|nr:hypothetical protein GA0115237_108247 [Streptomyces sp. ScaeMP-6W]
MLDAGNALPPTAVAPHVSDSAEHPREPDPTAGTPDPTTATAEQPAAPEKAGRRPGRPAREPMPLAVYILGLAVFALGTSEFMLSGLLPPIARDMDVTIPQAGLLISAFAVGMVVGCRCWRWRRCGCAAG